MELHSDFSNAEFRHTWKSFEQSATATAFQRLSYIQALLANIVPQRAVEPILVGVRDTSCGAIVLVASLMRTRRHGVSVIEALDLGLCDYFAPLIRPGLEFSAVEFDELWREICGALKPVGALSIEKIPAEIFGYPNPLAKLPSARPTNDFATTLRMRAADGAHLVDLQSYSVVRKANRLCRKPENWGNIQLELADTAAALQQALDLMVAHRLVRSHALGRHDLLDDRGFIAFYRQLAQDGLADGSVRVFVLSSDAEPIAVVYSLVHRNALTVVVPSMTTEERWRKLSPGLVAMVKCCEWADREGFHNFDLSVGALQYKTRFGGDQRRLYEIRQALSPAGLLITAEVTAKRRLRAFAARHPKAKALVRRMLRRPPAT
ncbi:GNAT family N-acetyltransferase [Rhodopseudomonas palustris]|uniref:GNAT family N-acetyltransferase n=1 Tax=Rhodopseudomonas palustris TaxID=1076 RepID=UPI00031DAC17